MNDVRGGVPTAGTVPADDLNELGRQWHERTQSLCRGLDASIQSAQDHAYALGRRRGAVDAQAQLARLKSAMCIAVAALRHGGAPIEIAEGLEAALEDATEVPSAIVEAGTSSQPLRIGCANWRGEVVPRALVPLGVVWGRSACGALDESPDWVLHAFDIRAGAECAIRLADLRHLAASRDDTPQPAQARQ
ncbi:hypothetical protein E4T66_17405 [Sinimarinibacterium sp. CAU 1509]|uniref:hypothetical protein n=1 Tax=Sinimarinibacterium sp. CAU 1509 TaxID=2562283 RepID=UPI0010AC8333|nr:hypothetical protein [Sinimarinibacterium sp. CAU 1509]TJY57188.1 hypothetical protein E4T66_17405 [Sinimarinibacterium sp. CAU 1509]